MPARYSCLLCGLSIEDYTSSHLEGWTHEYRTVYRNDGRTFVSGVARYDGDPVWRVPKDPALRWDAVQGENGLLEVPVMKAPAVDGLHGFVLHDACWNLLQRLPGASDLSLERLLSVCESLPFLLLFNAVGWGHNYEGLFKYWPEGFCPWLEQFRVTGPDVNGVILGALANPFNGPGIEATLSSIVAKAPSLKNPGRPFISTDCFSHLPWELCQSILLLLPTNDALNLRLASRAFLPLFSTITFWQSRFLPHGERGFLFEARDENIYNNLGKLVNLYRLTRRSVAAPDILNRERVWHLAQRLLVLTKPPLICNISGTQADDLDPQEWHSICSMVRMGDSSRGGIIRDIPHYPTTTIEIKVPSGAVRVGIAVVDTGVWDYVTGIRLIDQSGKSEFAGYLFEENE